LANEQKFRKEPDFRSVSKSHIKTNTLVKRRRNRNLFHCK